MGWIHILHVREAGRSEDVQDVNDLQMFTSSLSPPCTYRPTHILVSEAGQNLDLSQGPLAVGLVLKGTDLLDGHFGGSQVITSRAVRNGGTIFIVIICCHLYGHAPG